MIFLVYPLKVVLISALLFGYYSLFLRNKAFHQYNRFFLLCIPMIALLLPMLNIPIPSLYKASAGNAATRLLRVTQGEWEETITITARRSLFGRLVTLNNLLWLIYAAGALILFGGFIRSLLYIRQISRRYFFEHFDRVKFFHTSERGAPFSFFRRVFWNQDIDIHSEQGKQIFRHELFHVRQYHSLDIMLLESVTVVCWFNPFFHLIKKEIRAIHEFLADDWAAKSSNRHVYAELLVQQSIQSKYAAYIHPFFQNQLKRRIAMITKWKQIRNSYGSRLMALPILFMVFCLFAFRVRWDGRAEKSDKNIIVIIDAGHGGSDAGVTSVNGNTEKNISLEIASRIKTLAPEYNVTAILTRDKDELAGSTTDIRQSLEYRAGLASHTGADLFLSIHLNAKPEDPQANGFEIYVSAEKSEIQTRSIALGSLLAGSIKKDYTITDELKERSKGIYILSHATVPSVLIECGYLTNDRDEAFISDEKNQEKIARDILEGIVGYQNKLTGHAIPHEGALFTPSAIGQEEVQLSTDTVPKSNQGKKDIYKKVEFEAEYPGGQQAWMNFLFKTIHYPQKAIDKEIQGPVVVQFIVGTDGRIGDIKAISGPSLLRAESVRVIKASGKWTPARNGNDIVASYKKQPINYRLEAQ
jgi:N-acetylmuramoyl-L-alanine amidase